MLSKKETTTRLTRLRNTIQESNFTVEYIPGSLNKFADFLSRSKEVELNAIDFSKSERELVKQIHEEYGYAGAEIVRQFLKNTYKIDCSRGRIRNLLKNCKNYLKYCTPEKNLKLKRLELTEPFNRIHLDVIGPLIKSEQ